MRWKFLSVTPDTIVNLLKQRDVPRILTIDKGLPIDAHVVDFRIHPFAPAQVLVIVESDAFDHTDPGDEMGLIDPPVLHLEDLAGPTSTLRTPLRESVASPGPGAAGLRSDVPDSPVAFPERDSGGGKGAR